MPVIVKDETGTGEVLHTFTMEDLNEEMSLGEIIKARIYQEVSDHNRKDHQQGSFKGLVQPAGKSRQIDWEKQVEKAFEAFKTNGFFVLVDDKQAESLDQRFDVSVATEVSFVKLIPLVGG